MGSLADAITLLGACCASTGDMLRPLHVSDQARFTRALTVDIAALLHVSSLKSKCIMLFLLCLSNQGSHHDGVNWTDHGGLGKAVRIQQQPNWTCS